MPDLRSIADWRPRTPFFYGWVVLGAAALGVFAATGVTQLVLGGIQNLIFEEVGWDRGVIAYGVTIGTWASGLLTPLFGALVDRHGPRLLMPAGLVIIGVCLFGLSGIGAVWHFYAAYIVGRAITNPTLIGVVPRTVAVNFFQRRRNFALGLQAMQRPVAGAVNIQVISLIAQSYSWRTAYRALRAFSLLLVVPFLLLMRRRPEDIGLRPDGDSAPASRRAAGSGALGEVSWSARQALVTPAFRLIVAAEALIILNAGAIDFQIVPYLRDAGLPLAYAALALSLTSLLGAACNPVWGFMADRLSPRTVALIMIPVTAGVTSLLLTVHSGMAGFAIVIGWGIVSGGLGMLGSMMLADFFGRGSFGTIAGLTGPVQLGFLGLGPTFGSTLFSLTEGYTALFAYSVAAYGVSMLLIYAVKRPVRDRAGPSAP